jgi:L-alanine-DL-glutamate epimerase-like enolase superfamily enzyme
MKILDVQPYLLAIPIKEEDFPAPWVWGNFNQILVSITADDGMTGFGEAFGYFAPHAVFSVIKHLLRPMLIGADPASISALMDRMHRQTHFLGRSGITMFALSGVDIALWDMAAKYAGLPLYRLLGGAKADKIPAYASLVKYKDMEHLRAAALHAIHSGYDLIKLHQTDVESLATVRKAVGEKIRITLDVNCAWDPQQALDMARQLAPHGLYWLEEPIWPPEDFRSLAHLYRMTGIPIAAGENAQTVSPFKEMFESRAVTYAQPSVIKVGGISEWRKVAALAEAYNVRVNPHSPYFGPGLLATAHLVASSPVADWVEYLYVTLKASVSKQAPRFGKGYFYLPPGPGLGLEMDMDVIREYCVAS